MHGADADTRCRFEIRRRKVDGAINFTASHNPAEYHGLKFSGADGGPALPEVTHDIEDRAAKLGARAKPDALAYPSPEAVKKFEQIDTAPAYLDRLAELVNFETIRKAKIGIVYDALHGCGRATSTARWRNMAFPCIRFAPSAMCCLTAPAPTYPRPTWLR